MSRRASELIGFHDMANDDVMPTESPFDVERLVLGDSSKVSYVLKNMLHGQAFFGRHNFP